MCAPLKTKSSCCFKYTQFMRCLTCCWSLTWIWGESDLKNRPEKIQLREIWTTCSLSLGFICFHPHVTYFQLGRMQSEKVSALLNSLGGRVKTRNRLCWVKCRHTVVLTNYQLMRIFSEKSPAWSLLYNFTQHKMSRRLLTNYNTDSSKPPSFMWCNVHKQSLWKWWPS